MKVGDKAIALKAIKWGHGFTVGSEIVLINQEDENHFNFRGTGEDQTFTQVLHPTEFKVVEAGEPKLKAGDEVLVLNNNKWGHRFKIGSAVEFVEKEALGTYEFKGAVDGSSDVQSQWLHPSEFQVIVPLKEGDRVVLVTNGGFKTADFKPGTKGTILIAREKSYGVVLDSNPYGEVGYPWTFTPKEIKLDTEVQTPPQKEKEVSTVQTEIKAPKVPTVLKTLYAVQAIDANEVYIVTEDRDEAREVKAAEGGKAYGVTIVQYKAVKEIR